MSPLELVVGFLFVAIYGWAVLILNLVFSEKADRILKEKGKKRTVGLVFCAMLHGHNALKFLSRL